MLITVREARKLDLDPQDVLDINLYMIIWGVIGARILHVIADGHFMDYVNLCVDPHKVAGGRRPGQALQRRPRVRLRLPVRRRAPRLLPAAGLPGLGQAVARRPGLLRRPAAGHRLRLLLHPQAQDLVWRVADLAAPAIVLGLFFGRLGCFLNGCCYGKETTSAIGIRFPIGSTPVARAVRRCT